MLQIRTRKIFKIWLNLDLKFFLKIHFYIKSQNLVNSKARIVILNKNHYNSVFLCFKYVFYSSIDLDTNIKRSRIRVLIGTFQIRPIHFSIVIPSVVVWIKIHNSLKKTKQTYFRPLSLQHLKITNTLLTVT